MHDQWIREGHAFLILYSVDEQGTFDNAQAMQKKIERAKDTDTFPMVLVGNKCDKPNRAITKDQGAQKALEMGCPFVESSAKAGINVKEAFDMLVREVRKQQGPAGGGASGGAKGGGCCSVS